MLSYLVRVRAEAARDARSVPKEAPVQKMAAQYVAAKVIKELTQSRPATTSRDLDGQEFTDDLGRSLGTIRRLRELAVYVVVDETDEDADDADDALRKCLTERAPRVFAETADGQMTALIYVPSTLKPGPLPEPPAAPTARAANPPPAAPRPREAGWHADDV